MKGWNVAESKGLFVCLFHNEFIGHDLKDDIISKRQSIKDQPQNKGEGKNNTSRTHHNGWSRQLAFRSRRI